MNLADTKAGQVIALAAVVAVAAWWLSRKAAGASKLVNPTNSENLANRAVKSVGEAITGDRYWTLGGWLYEVTHPEEKAPAKGAVDASWLDSLLVSVPDTIQRRRSGDWQADNQAALEEFFRRKLGTP